MSANQQPQQQQQSRGSLCGNCRHFVAGGRCALVEGEIKAKMVCDLHEFGWVLPIDTVINPQYAKSQTNYRLGLVVQETVSGEMVRRALQMEHDLLARGVPEEEVHRAVISYFSEPEPPPALPWPGGITGLDLLPKINTVKVPSTAEPTTDMHGLPYDTQPFTIPNKSPYGIGDTSRPYPSFLSPDPNSVGGRSFSYDIKNHNSTPSENWMGLASDVNSEPSMHNEYGFNSFTTIPTFPDDYEALHSDKRIHSVGIPPSGALVPQIKEATPQNEQRKKLLELLAKWALLLGGVAGMNAIVKKYLDGPMDKPLEVMAQYRARMDSKTCQECRNANGKRFDLLKTHNRPVLPSEGLGYTTRHPNCRCGWDIKTNARKAPDKLTKDEQSEIHHIEDHVRDAAKKGDLHLVQKDGKLSKRKTRRNPLKEAFQSLRNEFDWLSDEYLSQAKKLAEENGGRLYLVRAAGETITNHMSEGEPYRRKLAAEELNKMTRTIIGKGMDINHEPSLQTDAIILDAEFDPQRKEMQTIVMEKDPHIIKAIKEGKITAVSINGGMPRSERIEPCSHHCQSNECELCSVPEGVVLGELDNIGMTWVVTDPDGIYWNSQYIPKADPGIKFTRIEEFI